MPRRRSGVPLPPGFSSLWTTVALDLVGFGIVLPILPLYAKRFHASSATAALLVAAFSAASFVFSPLWGRVSDRVGRKPVLLVSLAGTAVGSLLTGLATGMPLLFVARLIDGASGASVSVAQAAVADLARPDQRPRLFGLLGAAFGLGFVAGPAIGALGAVVDPRLPFLLAAGIAGVNALVAIRRLPETRQPDAAPAHRNPVRFRPDRGVGGMLAVAFCALVAFSGFEATFALFGQRHLGLTLGSSAAVFSAIGVVIVVVQGGLVRPVVAALGEPVTLRLGLLLDAGGLVMLALTRGWVLAVPALVALTVGQGLVQTTMTSTLAGRADPRRRGQVLGLQQSAGGLARVIGPAIGGALLGSQVSGAPYVLGAGLMVLALLLCTISLAWPEPVAVSQPEAA
ncbi:MAG: MFS transporter [Actinomycetota bacterium]|nr:MFS transporter [Actinomycetota bacterium]